MDRERYDYWCEKGILALLLGIFVFAVLATGAVRPLEWFVVQTLACGVLALWIPRLWLRKDYRVLMPPVTWAVLAFVIYAFARYKQADVEYSARSEWLKILVYAVVFFAILDNLRGQERLQPIVSTLVFLGMGLSLFAVYQFITKYPHIWDQVKPAAYVKRGSGTFICPNHLAGYLEMALPLGLAWVLAGRASHTMKVFLGYASAAMLAGLAVSVSRGGWIAASAGLVLVFVVAARNRALRIPILLLLVVLSAGAVLFVKKAYHAQQRLDQMVVDGGLRDARFQLWKPAVQIWQEHFWWGAGPAHYDHAFRKFRPTDVQMRPLYAHSDYLNTLADYGLAGLLLILFVLALLFWGVIKTWKFVQRTNDIASKPSNRASLVLGSAAGLVALMVHSFLDFNLHIPANALVAIALMALLTAHFRFATERFWFNPRWFGKVAGTALLMVVLGYLGQQAWIGLNQEILKARAAKASTNESRVTLLREAVALDEKNIDLVAELAETLRLWSWKGNPGYDELAREAMKWFKRGVALNPYDPYPPARHGMCLDLLKRYDEAEPFFQRAVELDPKNYFILGLRGWHYFEKGDYAESKKWFEQSRHYSLWRLDAQVRDEFPAFYLRKIEERLREAGVQP